jgi:hypothetical protein
MFDRLILTLQSQLAVLRYTFGQDVNKLSEIVSGADIENRRIEKLRAVLPQKSLTQFLSKTSILAPAAAVFFSTPITKFFLFISRQASLVFSSITKATSSDRDKLTCYVYNNPGYIIFSYS